jgi:hypothetical protein
MSARIVAVTQLLLDVLADPRPDAAYYPSEIQLAQLLLPICPEIIGINLAARAEMGARVIEVLDT